MKVILFDIDGTLIRAGGAGRKALNRATFRLYGKKNACSELSLAGRTDLWNFRQAFQAAKGRIPSARELDRLHREYLKRLPRFVSQALREGTYIFPAGIKSLLRNLRRRKEVLLGLGTGNMEGGARIKLEPSGFNDYFAFGGFGSDSLKRDMLLKKAVSRASRVARRPIKRGDVFVIGDTPHDVSAGKKAGYKTVAVGTGFSSWESLVRSRPDHLARDFRETRKWLNWFGIRP